MDLPEPSCQEEEDYMKKYYSKEYYGELYDESELYNNSKRDESRINTQGDNLPF